MGATLTHEMIGSLTGALLGLGKEPEGVGSLSLKL